MFVNDFEQRELEWKCRTTENLLGIPCQLCEK